MLAESIIDNSQYTGKESKGHRCREVSIAIFTELIRTLAPMKNIEEEEWRAKETETTGSARRVTVRYVFASVMDSWQSVEILDNMCQEENTIWETLIDRTEAAASWILDAEESDGREPLFAVIQMFTKILIEESKCLQTKAIRGLTRIKDPLDVVRLRERYEMMRAVVMRYKNVLWTNKGYVPGALMNLIRAIETVNTYVRTVIEEDATTIRTATRKRGRLKETPEQTVR